MRNLQKWEPFKDLWDVHNDLDKFFFGRRHRRGEEEGELVMWSPAMDIYEDKNDVKLYCDLPGMSRKDISINVEDGVLTVKGERKFSEEEKKDNYCRVERAYGSFRRSFTLPNNVNPDKIQANMKDGILTITVPKKEEAKPKEIEIKVD